MVAVQTDSARPTHNVSEQPAPEAKSAESSGGVDKDLTRDLTPGDMQVIASMVVPTTLIVAAYETPGKPRPLPLEDDRGDIVEEADPKAASRPTSPPFSHQFSPRPTEHRGTHELIGRDGHVHVIDDAPVPLVRRRTPPPAMDAEQSDTLVSRSNRGLRGLISRAANRVRDILYTGSFSGVRSPSPKHTEETEEARHTDELRTQARSPRSPRSPPQVNSDAGHPLHGGPRRV